MTETTKQTASDWFADWLAWHKAVNRHNGWAAFEEPGPAIVYLGWARAFDVLGVTPTEAQDASLKLQRSGECWPVDHLPRLLTILSPVVAARKADEACARRRALLAEAEAERDAYLRARDEWRSLPEADRSRMLASIRRRFPALVEIPRFVERFAVDEWRGRGIEPGPDPRPAPAPDPDPAPEPADAPLTQGQVDLVAALGPDRARALDACSPGKRRMLLLPHASGFDGSLLGLVASELPALAEPVAEAVAV